MHPRCAFDPFIFSSKIQCSKRKWMDQKLIWDAYETTWSYIFHFTYWIKNNTSGYQLWLGLFTSSELFFEPFFWPPQWYVFKTTLTLIIWALHSYEVKRSFFHANNPIYDDHLVSINGNVFKRFHFIGFVTVPNDFTSIRIIEAEKTNLVKHFELPVQLDGTQIDFCIHDLTTSEVTTGWYTGRVTVLSGNDCDKDSGTCHEVFFIRISTKVWEIVFFASDE